MPGISACTLYFAFGFLLQRVCFAFVFRFIIRNYVLLWIVRSLTEGLNSSRSCRFYCSLRGHQRTGKKDSEEPFLLYPEPRKRGSVDSNSLTQGNRCGGSLPLTAMVCTNIVCAILVSCGRLRFRIFCLAFVFRFSFVLMEDRRCLYRLYRSFL